MAVEQRQAQAEKQRLADEAEKERLRNEEDRRRREEKNARKQAQAEAERLAAEEQEKVDNLLEVVAAAAKGDLTRKIDVSGNEPVNELAAA